MLFRKKGTADFFFGAGDICAPLVVAWRARPAPLYDTFVPDVSPGIFAELFVVLDPQDWEAFPFEIRSPLNLAARAAGADLDGNEVTVPPSSSTGFSGMVAAKVGPTEDLQVVSARLGFGQLPLAFLRTLAAHYSLDQQVNMLDTIVGLVKHLIPDVQDNDLTAILQRRIVSAEIPADLREVLDDEQIVEASDAKEVLCPFPGWLLLVMVFGSSRMWSEVGPSGAPWLPSAHGAPQNVVGGFAYPPAKVCDVRIGLPTWLACSAVARQYLRAFRRAHIGYHRCSALGSCGALERGEAESHCCCWQSNLRGAQYPASGPEGLVQGVAVVQREAARGEGLPRELWAVQGSHLGHAAGQGGGEGDRQGGEERRQAHPPDAAMAILGGRHFAGASQRLAPTGSHSRHSESWSKYRDSSHQAMVAADKFVWVQWLADNHLSEADCPIKGLFE